MIKSGNGPLVLQQPSLGLAVGRVEDIPTRQVRGPNSLRRFGRPRPVRRRQARRLEIDDCVAAHARSSLFLSSGNMRLRYPDFYEISGPSRIFRIHGRQLLDLVGGGQEGIVHSHAAVVTSVLEVFRRNFRNAEHLGERP